MCLEAAVAALRQNFVTETGSPQWETLDALVSQAEASDNRTAGHAHGGAEANSASSSNANYAEVLQRVLASPQGSALRRVFADLDAQQLLQGLAGKKGRPLRDLASNALAERLRVSLRFPWRPRPRPRPAQSAAVRAAVAPTTPAPTAPTAPAPAPTAYERRQRERREKSMKIIGGLQLQRFRGRAAAVAIVSWPQLLCGFNDGFNLVSMTFLILH